MKQRIITAIAALIVVLPFLFYGGWPFILFAVILATIGLHELLIMRKLSKSVPVLILSYLLLWALLARIGTGTIPYLGLTKIECLTLFGLLLLGYTVLSKNRFTFDDAGFVALTAIYVGMGFYYLIEARLNGLDYLFFIFFIVWATDSGAYFVGRKLGKRKLWPVISPNKTIEGAIGGIVLGCLVGVVFQLIHPFDHSLLSILGVAFVISIAGQLGDLAESAFKRHYNVKDSGKLLPGHGGVLDRLDSMIFVMPLLHLIHFI